MRLSLRAGWLSGLVLILVGADCGAPRLSGAASGPGTSSGNGGQGGGLAPPGLGTLPPPGDAGNANQLCAEEAHKAEAVPLDLMMVVDSSASMNDFAGAGTETKWELATTALSAFVRDPKSAGLGIGLQFFPLGYPKPCTTNAECFPGLPGTGFVCAQVTTLCVGPGGFVPGVRALVCEPRDPTGSPRPGYPGCPMGTKCMSIGKCSGSGAQCAPIGQACPMGGGMCLDAQACLRTIPAVECEIARYETPTVPIGTVPMSEMALTTTLRAWSPGGGTSMGPAVQGVLSHLRARLAANPGRKAALVLVGDGLPDGCSNVAFGEPGMNDIPGIATTLGEAFMGNPSIPSYVIGVFAPADLAMSRVDMDRLARAGGTDRAYVLNATSDLTQRLQEALDQIRGAASLACEFTIPPPRMGAIDWNKVNVRYTGPAGPENIPYVERADRCDPMRGGWYYDVEPARDAPQRIQVCEATCRRFKTEQNAQVDLLFGCARVIL
jgi:hypothetical protein